ncbi:hypothetical protein KI387_033473, partial [Taxus chinensis]
ICALASACDYILQALPFSAELVAYILGDAVTNLLVLTVDVNFLFLEVGCFLSCLIYLELSITE